MGVFGSGWAWLYADVATGKLHLTTTANQDTPLNTPGHRPLLTLDVWEVCFVIISYFDVK